MSHELQRTPRWIRAFQFFQFSFGMLLWLPVFYELQKRAGLSEAQIFSIQTYYYVAFCLLELPTGFIADRLGYRFSLCLGGAVGVLANLCPVFSSSYIGFLSQFLLVAVSRSFVSGAASAYLYERLSLDSAHSAYRRVEGTARALGLLGKVFGWSVVGFWVDRSPEAPFWASAAFLAAATVAALGLPALPSKAGGPRRGFATDWIRVARSVLSGQRFFWLLLQGVGLFVLGRVVQVNLYQPILKAHDVSVSGFGVGMAVMTLLEAWGAWRPDWLPSVLKGQDDCQTVTRLTLLCALCLPLFVFPTPFGGSLKQTIAATSLGVFAWAMGAGYPLQKKVLNEAIPDSTFRASFLSLESIVDRAFNALVVAALGAYFTGATHELWVSLNLISVFFLGLGLLVHWGLRPKKMTSPTLL